MVFQTIWIISLRFRIYQNTPKYQFPSFQIDKWGSFTSLKSWNFSFLGWYISQTIRNFANPFAHLYTALSPTILLNIPPKKASLKISFSGGHRLWHQKIRGKFWMTIFFHNVREIEGRSSTNPSKSFFGCWGWDVHQSCLTRWAPQFYLFSTFAKFQRWAWNSNRLRDIPAGKIKISPFRRIKLSHLSILALKIWSSGVSWYKVITRSEGSFKIAWV